MAEWDGRKLPPVAAQRVRRAASGGPWTSLLTVPGAAGLRGTGFEPVGEVMGSMVLSIGFAGYGGCDRRTVTSSERDRFAGFAPYVRALDSGYRTALARMVAEAAAIGADGIVGVDLAMHRIEGSAREFTALGTAVRARSATRPERIFVSHLAGQDMTKLVRSGWMATDLVFGLSVGIRHDDHRTRVQSSWRGGNVEVAGYTELVTHVRADARDRFRRHVEQTGADGAVVSSTDLRVWDVEPSDSHRDHIAEATVFGTALVQFATAAAAPTRTLTYLPLS